MVTRKGQSQAQNLAGALIPAQDCEIQVVAQLAFPLKVLLF